MITSNYWRYMFAVPMVIVSLQSVMIFLFFRYESPMFSILKKDDVVGAEKVLKKIYFEEDVPVVIQYIRTSNMTTVINKWRVSFRQALFGWGIWEQTWVAICIMVFRVLAGNSTMNQYSSIIYKQLG